MTRVAVIDCGTNTTRLLVRDEQGDRVRLSRVTGLGRGLGASGRLDRQRVGDTLDAVSDHLEVMGEQGVERTRVLCTSAVRDAANAADLIEPLAERVGVTPEVLSGVEEARLSYQGARAALDEHEGVTLVVDIGGGSTEFAVGRGQMEGSISVDIGSVRLTERYLAGDPPRPEELHAVLSIVEAHLDDVVRELPLVAETDRFVGVAGTVTTVAAVEIGLARWDRDRIHGFRLERAAAEDVFRTLATESLADRVHNPGLAAERADVIVAGSAILCGVMRRLDLDTCLVSDADLLDGAAAELLA